MKKLKLFIFSFSQNIISSILLVIILVVAILSVQDIISQYRYINYSKYIIENKYLQNSDYFMINSDRIGGDPNELFEYTASVKEQIAKMDGIKGVADISYFGTLEYKLEDKTGYTNYQFYNEYMTNAFSNQLSEGTWFGENKNPDIPDVIVGGAAFDNVAVGSTIQISLTDSNYNNTPHQVHVIGKIDYPWYSVEYTTISNKVSTKDFLSVADMMIFEDTEENRTLFETYTSPSTSLAFSYFVLYDDDCTEEQKQACRDYYNTVGSYLSYDTVLSNTEDNIRNELMKKMVTPVFLLVIATITLISISTLNTYKKLKDHSVYYLCGCSRKKSFMYLFMEISMVAIIATVIDIFYISIQINGLRNGTIIYSSTIIDYWNIVFVVAYCIVTILVTTILPFIVYHKNTPLEIYRRNHND
ncbi:MAG: ABC transporter permease [Acutalibacteraceae bacterium]